MAIKASMKAQSADCTTSLESLPFDELLSLRDQLDRLIKQRISAEERDLEERLARLKMLKLSPASFSEEQQGPSGSGSRKLPIRYRNPDDPSQVWAGRGLQPRWLKQALKSGKKLADFLVPDFE